MATPRKHWFRVEDSIRREGWDNDVLAFAVRLMALLNDQWARDGITDRDEACRISLGPAALADCAGCQSPARALSIARRLAADSTLTVDRHGTRTQLYWPKYAEIQLPDARISGNSRPEIAPSAPAPSDAPARRKKRKSEKRPLAERKPLIPDPSKLVRILNQEPGSLEAKTAWLIRELPNIQLLAQRDYADDEDRLGHEITSRVFRHYRQHLKSPQAGAGRAKAAPGSVAARRELAQHLYSVESVLEEPTVDALARWEQAGQPTVRGWWLPEEDRPKLS